MRLFHVSEEPNITRFEPRLPTRKDLDPTVGLVWAINEHCLPNFFTPRECPRVTYHADESVSAQDIARFFSGHNRHAVCIEHAWHKAMLACTLYIYEFDPAGFVLQDDIAGYYVSEQAQTPINVTRVDDIYGALFARGVEVRLLDNLWPLARAVQQSTLRWSICDFTGAQPET